MVDHYELRPHIRFGVEVGAASYDEEAKSWTLLASDPDGDELRFAPSNILISAVGIFSEPSVPDLPGCDDFQGEVFHSAEWPADLDLAGKRVAVVGNGASAMQIVPAIVDEVESLTIFQRSPQWIAPNEEYFAPVSERRPLADGERPLLPRLVPLPPCLDLQRPGPALAA